MTTDVHQDSEMEMLRARSRTLGIEDIESPGEIGEEIADAVWHHADNHGVAPVVKSVYVCGSYASGDAIPGVSDFDVRVVVEGLDVAVCEAIKTELHSSGFDIIPEEAGYLDAHIEAESPAEHYEHALIWEADN